MKKAAVVAAMMLIASGGAMAQYEAQQGFKVAEERPFELMVGDKAPEMDVGGWVQGAPVTGFEKGQAYIVEFWATWCGPCKAAIPHLSEIQEKFGDKLRVVGVSVWEQDFAKVEPFVKTEMADKMIYTVAFDHVPAYPEGVSAGTREAQKHAVGEGAMSKTWMKAAGRNGIPSTFIVNGAGQVAWIGHPMSPALESTLQAVIDGSHDIKKAAAEYAEAVSAEGLVEKYFAAFEAGEFDKAYPMGHKLVAGPAKNNAQMLNQIAWFIVDPMAKPAKQDLDLAMKAAQMAVELTEGKDGAILDTLAAVYYSKGDLKKAIEIQKKAVEVTTPQFEQELKSRLEQYLKELENKGG